MKYLSLIATVAILGCTKNPAQQDRAKVQGQAQPVQGEGATNRAAGTDIHQGLNLSTLDSGEIRAPYLPSPKEQREIDALNEEAKAYVRFKSDQKQGLAAFKERCSPCHGPEGRGSGPLAGELPVTPTNFHEWQIKYGHSLGDIAFSILRGRNDQSMPAMGAGMKKDELWSLAYLVSGWIEARPDAATLK